MDTIVLDHAHCEKKAASTAVSLLFRYPERLALMRPLSELAREELEHFEQVLEVIEDRGGVLERQHPSTYAKRLCSEIRTSEPGRLVDTLLCCALIEARSCERMQLLAENLEDEALAGLYRGLLHSEARHHQIYVDLAAGVVGMDLTLKRLDALAAHEAAVLEGGEQPVRLHS
jgi:tRNA-(ms[2]io[6]A)-hydroxylase